MQARRRGELEDAADCFRRAARAGHAKAMVNLGSMYEKGEGVDQDDTQAVHFFRAAAELDNLAAVFARLQDGVCASQPRPGQPRSR